MLDDIYNLPMGERSLGPVLGARVREDADRPYLTYAERTWTFSQTDAEVRAVARGLAARGIGKGDYLALMLPNCAEFVFAWYAACLRGAAMVPVNPQYRGFLLDAPLRETRTRGIVIHHTLTEALATIDPEIYQRLDWIAVVGGTGEVDLPKGPARIITFEDLKEPDGEDPEVACDYRDIHSVMYTSGTTGPSKGVLIANGHFFSSACVFLRAVGLTRDDVLFTPLPLFHGLASRLGVLPALMVGAHIVVAERFSATRFWQQAAECRATVGHTIFTIPPILKAQPPGPQDRAHNLRCMYNAHHDQEFEERFGVRLVEAYGMTETGLVVYTPYPERRQGAAGRIHEDWEGRIVDTNDFSMPSGEIGEIVLRPRLPFIMMQGYLDKPQDTLEAWRNLWFHTGDIARMDEDGYVFFVDRKKDRIRRRGENISSWDVENYVGAHPSIAECVALPHPATTGEDDVRVVVVFKDGTKPDVEALAAWLEERMPPFMVPRYIEILDELPRNPTSKVEKYKLVNQGLGTDAYDREAAAGKRRRTG